MPNRKIAEDIIQAMKGSTFTHEDSAQRNGGLNIPQWMGS